MVINLKNKWWIILILIIIIAIGVSIFIFTRKNNNSNKISYTSNKISASNTNSTKNNINAEKKNIEATQNSTMSVEKTEEEISSFSTKIYTKDSARQNNISITCSTLNGTIVTNGSTFSFCNTIGQATSSKGYQEADIFDQYGNKKKGLGGGNCQVSTTLYNAILKVPGLSIVERHEHSNKVPYIETGKDAAVAYGSYDLKFKNNTGFDIRIETNVTNNNVKIVLYKIT